MNSVDDLLALSGLLPRQFARKLGVSWRELHEAHQRGATGHVAEALHDFEDTLAASLGAGRQWRRAAGEGAAVKLRPPSGCLTVLLPWALFVLWVLFALALWLYLR